MYGRALFFRRMIQIFPEHLKYLDCVSQYYDIPVTERSDDEINMLRQVFSMFIEFSILSNVNLFCPIFDKLLLFFLLDCR
jgi:hypothetical protein